MNLCIISESRSAERPESFIKAHKEMLDGNVHFLYGSTLPLFSEKRGSLARYPGLSERFLIALGCRKAESPLISGLRHYLQSEGIDIVLAEYGTTGAQVFPVCRALGIPLVVHFHGYDISKKEVLEYHRTLYPELFSYASGIIAVSEDMREDLLAAGAPSEKVSVTPCGPNDKFFQLQPDYTSNTILAVGRMVDKKAPYYTILAFRELLQDFPSLQLRMIGSGYLEYAMRNLVQALCLQDNVHIQGWVQHDEIEQNYQNAFCFVQHSIVAGDGDCEGTPVGVLEASAAGLPVVSTRHKGIKDVVREGVTGILVDEHDVQSMTKALKKLAADRAMAASMGLEGRNFVQANFSMEKHISVINQVVRQALK
ncbi:MAG TPA: glycosyltransferase [Lacibacter sp.]|nr:glycosyltransferase [Lacibacter sp.]HMO88659.1 glycosyltransferase [Lacibacter sp.]